METQTVLIYVLLGVVVILGITVLVISAMARARLQKVEKAMTEQHEVALKYRTEQVLRLVALPMLWAIRQELMRENYDQIEQYIRQYIKEPGIENVGLTDKAGTFLLASNKKWEGSPYAAHYSDGTDLPDHLSIYDAGNNKCLILAPVMGLNERLGTLVFEYGPIRV